ncbi:hypothetical protein GE061_007092 [Apolygus lucorum]|uniref:Uncharacterized protein n=1 Tax=Apolygus lucorum TaxID=248454 RepID=A0A8S9WQY9_APOLU|nr:hypothetical protein GE061_007092 [Apolygus lucorum]
MGSQGLPLKIAFLQKLIPAITGHNVNDDEQDLFSLPVKLGGLAIEDPVASAQHAYETSKAASLILTSSIATGTPFDSTQHEVHLSEELKTRKMEKKERELARRDSIVGTLPMFAKRKLNRIVEGNASQSSPCSL